MKYKSDTLLEIVRRLMRPHGATINELSEELSMNRRTILRWLDRIAVQYPNLDGRRLNGAREKHWSIPVGAISSPELTTASAQEIDALERYAKICEAHSKHGEAAAVRSILARNEISGFVSAGTKISDFEYFISRQFYIERIEPAVLKTIVSALRDDRYLVLEKYVKASGETVSREIAPLILLTDLSRYVIGFERGKSVEPKSFLLARVAKASLGEPLCKADLRRKMKFVPDFYIRNSFSIYRGEKEMNVKLRFSGRAAFPASQFHFAAGQKIRRVRGGDTHVEFKARGVDAICNHLFTWGENVRIISPKSLANAYRERLEKALKNVPDR